ncbi:MAG: hypothetical protein V3S82_05320, partial [Dehalococcoidia bacterium]
MDKYETGGLSIPSGRAREPLARVGAYLVLVVAAILLLGACQPSVTSPPPPTRVPNVQAPRPAPAPAPAPTPETPPTPAPPKPSELSDTEVEQLVWSLVHTCSDQITESSEIAIKIAFDTQYIPEDGQWLVIASSKTPALSFGKWQVMDSTAEITPVDRVATDITDTETACGMPVSLLSTGKTPPQFLEYLPVSLLATEDEVRLRVWVSVYNCYRHWPLSADFTASFDQGLQRWVVEGRSGAGTANYGLWLVDAAGAEITPYDRAAKQAADFCTPAPSALTAEQATIRVWVSIYDCFKTDPPSFDDIKAYQESPQRWVVEGKSSTTTTRYGLWLVDTDTARITPKDDEALLTAAKSCYRV